VPVSQIDTTGLTHLVFSFATIDPKTFAVGPMHPDDEKLYADFLALNDGSQKWIGIGESPTQHGTLWSGDANMHQADGSSPTQVRLHTHGRRWPAPKRTAVLSPLPYSSSSTSGTSRA
jgi:hypothetical protein